MYLTAKLGEFLKTWVSVVVTLLVLFPEGIFICKDYVADGALVREKNYIQIVLSSDDLYRSPALAFPTCDLRVWTSR